MGTFTDEVESFSVDVINVSLKSFRDIAKAVFASVINRTPIFFEHEATTGMTKANWNTSIGTPDLNHSEIVDQTGVITIARMAAVVDGIQGDGIVHLTNTSDHILKLENGGYTKNPKLGSYNTLTKSYEIRSAGGYSKQAPRGMVKVTVAEFEMIASTIIDKNNASIK